MLPTLAPYPVDYFSTASYYWPNIVENATQISNTINSGTETYEPTPENGPFGFGAALKVDGTEVWQLMRTAHLFLNQYLISVHH